MKPFTIKSFIIAGLVAPFFFVTGLVTSAQRTSFNWSYVFDTGGKVEGMLDADRPSERALGENIG